MVFSSLAFLYAFLPLTFLLYFTVPKKLQNVVLLLSGLIFYAWGEPVYILVMLFSTFVDYMAGRLMARYDEQPKIRLVFLIVSVCVNLGMLAVFKYNSFVVQNVNMLFGTGFTDPKIPLPIGISFYTFQSMSYTIDLYRRNIKVQKSFLNFATYVSLFPQIVAGPIVRYEDVQNEIDKRAITTSMIGDGVGQFVKGLAKKVLLANNIGALWTVIKATPVGELSVASAWLGILAFTFQIYYDFSGYSDMACGLGRMMGFNFPSNFNFPYIAKSVSEFWRRWHITLSSWFKSYVYIPLGGNRHGLLKTVRNLLIVWFLTGLWHGASWNFVLWGLYFGVLIILERLFLLKWLEKLPGFLRVAYTFLLVVVGWVLFEFESLTMIGRYLGAMFGLGTTGLVDSKALFWLASYAVVFVLCIFFSGEVSKRFVQKLDRKLPKCSEYLRPVLQLAGILLCTAYLVDATFNPFLYFRF